MLTSPLARALATAFATALLFAAPPVWAAAPTGLVQTPVLRSFNIDEGDLDQTNALRQNELQNVTISGYVDIKPGKGYIQIEVARFGDDDTSDDAQWIVLAEHIAPSSTTKTVGTKIYNTFSKTLKAFDLARSEDTDEANRIWSDGGMARIRFRGVRTDGTGPPALLPTLDVHGNKTRSGQVILVDENVTRETAPTYTKTDGSIWYEPYFLGNLGAPLGGGETLTYYQTVGTNPDGSGQSVSDALHTLKDFKNRYFVSPVKPPGSPSGCSTRAMTVDDTNGGPAIYFNRTDLGTGRKMRCNYNSCADETACYVSNLGLPDGEVGLFDGEHGLTQSTPTVTSNMPFATVAMVERGKMAKDALNRVFFAVYDHDGQYIDGMTAAQAQAAQDGSPLGETARLDNIGWNDFIPGNCGVCHGGVAYQPDKHGIAGAMFLPFDVQNFDFYPGTTNTQDAQEGKFRTLNKIVAQTDIWDLADGTVKPARVIMNKWYGTSETNSNPSVWTSKFKKNQIPGNDWSANSGQKQLYLSVVAPGCRTCHMTHTDNSWATFAEFNTDRISIHYRVCKLRVDVDQAFNFNPTSYSMPQSEQASNAFWRSEGRAQLVDRLKIAQGCGLTTDQFSPDPASAVRGAAVTSAPSTFYTDYANAVCACTTTACFEGVEDDYAKRLAHAGRTDTATTIAALKRASDCRAAIRKAGR
jgi:hypothetical protein